MGKYLLVFLLFLNISSLYSQKETVNVVPHGLFLLNQNMTADMVGLAGIGVVGSEISFQNALAQNPALLHRKTKQFNTSFSVASFANGSKLNSTYLSSDNHYVINSRHALGVRIQYQSIGFGVVQAPPDAFVSDQTISLKIAYSNRLSKHLVFGLTLMTANNQILNSSGNRIPTLNPERGFALDLGLSYKRKFKINDQKEFMFQWGGALNNFGPETQHSFFEPLARPLPTSIRFGLGFGLDQQLKEGKNFQLNFFYQFDKLLLQRDVLFNTGIQPGFNNGFVSRMFSSLNDAPNGFVGELEELTHHFVLEGRLEFQKDCSITARLGYQNKGILNMPNFFGFSQGIKITYKNLSFDCGRHDFPVEYENGDLYQDFLTVGVGAKFLFNPKEG